MQKSLNDLVAERLKHVFGMERQEAVIILKEVLGAFQDILSLYDNVTIPEIGNFEHQLIRYKNKRVWDFNHEKIVTRDILNNTLKFTPCTPLSKRIRKRKTGR